MAALQGFDNPHCGLEGSVSAGARATPTKACPALQRVPTKQVDSARTAMSAPRVCSRDVLLQVVGFVPGGLCLDRKGCESSAQQDAIILSDERHHSTKLRWSWCHCNRRRQSLDWTAACWAR